MPLINVIEAYQKAFGGAYSPLNTIPIVLPAGVLKDILFDTDRETPTIEVDRLSALGTPMHFPCSLGDLELPNEPIIRITGMNRLIRTPLDGHDGRFKEFFARDDYEVVIRGIAINEENPDMYPDTIIRQIREICESGAVEVTCKLLSYFNINQLAIEKYDFPAIEGVIWQPYEIKCYSDQPFELEIEDA